MSQNIRQFFNIQAVTVSQITSVFQHSAVAVKQITPVFQHSAVTVTQNNCSFISGQLQK